MNNLPHRSPISDGQSTDPLATGVLPPEASAVNRRLAGDRTLVEDRGRAEPCLTNPVRRGPCRRRPTKQRRLDTMVGLTSTVGPRSLTGGSTASVSWPARGWPWGGGRSQGCREQ